MQRDWLHRTTKYYANDAARGYKFVQVYATFLFYFILFTSSELQTALV